MQRYVLNRQSARFDKQQCPYCGSFACNQRIAVCKCCNSPQCHGNGGANGQCSICYVGLLPDWSGARGTCGYKNCGKEAVARGRGGKYVCADHAKHQKIGEPHLEGFGCGKWVLVD